MSKETFDWPNARDDQSKIIEQFKFLQDHLTAESAAVFCGKAPGCGFLYALYETNHLDDESIFQAYLSCLRTLVPLVSRSELLGMFPKGCSGCAL